MYALPPVKWRGCLIVLFFASKLYISSFCQSFAVIGDAVGALNFCHAGLSPVSASLLASRQTVVKVYKVGGYINFTRQTFVSSLLSSVAEFRKILRDIFVLSKFIRSVFSSRAFACTRQILGSFSDVISFRRACDLHDSFPRELPSTVHFSVRQKMVSASVLTLFHQLLPVAQNHISAPRHWVLRPALPSHLLLAVCVLVRNSKGTIALSGTWSHGSVPCTLFGLWCASKSCSAVTSLKDFSK